MNPFFKGTILLTAAAFIGECVEFFINMVLARSWGEGAWHVYGDLTNGIFNCFPCKL